MQTYKDFIHQTYNFPQQNFDLKEGTLSFHGVPLMSLIQKYGAPFKMTYLPKIGEQVQQMRDWFSDAFEKLDYGGNYQYCYCTKSSPFNFVVEKVLEQNAQLEVSSAFDIVLIRKLFAKGKLDKNTIIICNGFKPEAFLSAIVELIHDGFENVIPIIDNVNELDYYEKEVKGVCKIGLRIASEEKPHFGFYASRMGIRREDILPLFREKIQTNKRFKLEMLHFFVDAGIEDSSYYWEELEKVSQLYCQIKKDYLSLAALNIGGGMPIQNDLKLEFDYKKIVFQIVANIQKTCKAEKVVEPDIFTEFGKYTVGESAATIFSVLAEKKQSEGEIWYIIDNSLLTTMPDIWGMSAKFVLLPVNKWENDCQKTNIGGITCDNVDYYELDAEGSKIHLPKLSPPSKMPLYIGFFHTGAYQDSLGGYGGIRHCLIPAPKHILVDKDEAGKLIYEEYRPEQNAEEMLAILGY